MELKIGTDVDKWNIHCVIMLREDEDGSETYTMIGEISIPKAQCGTPESLQNTVHGAISHMVHKMVNKWRLSLVHTLREAVVEALQSQTSPGEAPRTATSDVPATNIAEGVVPPPARDATLCDVMGHDWIATDGNKHTFICTRPDCDMVISRPEWERLKAQSTRLQT